MRIATAAVCVFLLQDAAPAGPDRVVLTSREELGGEIQSYRREGLLVLKSAGKVRSLPVEDIARLFFEPQPVVTSDAGEKIRLQHGVLLTVRGATYSEKRFSVETVAGPFVIDRSDVKSLAFAPLDGNVPEARDEKGDLVLWKPKGDDKGDLKAAYGDLAYITADKLVLKPEKGDAVEVDRKDARALFLYQQPLPRDPMPTGWFAKLQFKNGDRITGILRSLDGGRVVVFSHLLGAVSAPKAQLHSVQFVQSARLSMGNLLVCESNGVRELDRTGKEVWRYQVNISYPWSARKLDNGNVLVANTNYNQVLEIRPKDKEGGDVVWQLEGLNYPYDVHRLENGNTLVAEYYANRVAEYEPKDRKIVWQTTKCNYPISCQRLENGHTLIGSMYQVVEVNGKQEEKWRAALAGVRAWRAERLDNGHTLIVDQQRGQVIEIDPKSREVWRKDGLATPTAAIRLDDGNTLILEQRRNQIIEVDAAGKVVGTITGLNYPLHLSIY